MYNLGVKENWNIFILFFKNFNNVYLFYMYNM